MENIQVSSQNPTVEMYRNKLQNSSNATNSNTESKQIENGNNKLKKALIGLGVIGTAGIALALVIKGKGHKLSDIKFDRSIATIGNDGEKFTGTIVDKLKNGDKITMVYKDGVLQGAQRKGKINIQKTYTTNENGEKIVKKIVNGTEQEINITKKVNEVKESKDSIQKLKDKISSMSADSPMSEEDFEKELDAIKYKSKNDTDEINKLIDKKKTLEDKNKGTQPSKDTTKAKTENEIPKERTEKDTSGVLEPAKETPEDKNKGTQSAKNLPKVKPRVPALLPITISLNP